MPELQALSFSRHGDLCWRGFRSYAFARQRGIVPLAMAELGRAVGTLPVALTPRGSGYGLSALLGIEPDRNLFVASDGRWRGDYVPAYLRGHPFYAVDKEEGGRVVAVDEGSGLLSADDPEGHPLFDAQGNPSDSLQPVLDFLEKLAHNRYATERACDALAEEGVIEPWPVQVTDEQGQSRSLEGLYRVRETGLNDLGGEGLARLRDVGALQIAYGQLLGQSSVRRLSELARLDAREQGQQAPGGVDWSQVFAEGDGLNFDWSQLDE